MEYYESRLTALERDFYRKIIQGFQQWAPVVKSSYIVTMDSFKKCVHAVEYDRPDFFYVDFFNWTYRQDHDGWALLPSYVYNQAEGTQKMQQFLSIAAGIKREIDKAGMRTVYEKCNYIHSYLVKNCKYDYQAYADLAHPQRYKKSYTLEGPLFYGIGVCQGISMAFRALCRKCSINAFMVEGKAASLIHGSHGAYEDHAWNLVYMGDWSAQVDVTWDLCLSECVDFVKKDYFFIPDIDMAQDHRYIGYPPCKQIQMSYFDVNHLVITKLKDLDAIIKKDLFMGRRRLEKGKHYIYFKVADPKLTFDKVQNYVVKKIEWYVRRKNILIYHNEAINTYLFDLTV